MLVGPGHSSTTSGVLEYVMRLMDYATFAVALHEQSALTQAMLGRVDDVLSRLNESHLGGGHLQREGDVIHAAYDRCYCGSVSKAREPLSATYCRCSCGWYRQLFETLLDRPVEVELLSSIAQGHPRCRFLIRIREPKAGAGAG